jgi:hypothetical protein
MGLEIDEITLTNVANIPRRCTRGHEWTSTMFDTGFMLLAYHGIECKPICLRCLIECLERECGTEE